MITQEVPVLAGKQRELQQRDELILDLARDIYLKEGYHQLSIARLAKASGFSRPTLYDRFNSKEELLFELGIRWLRKLIALLREASECPGRPRERMVSVLETIREQEDQYADELQILHFSRSDAVLGKVPAELQKRFTDLNKQTWDILRGIIKDAEREGDLVFRAGMTADRLAMALIALVEGVTTAMRGATPLDEVGISDPMEALIESVHVLCDGCGWQPLHDGHVHGGAQCRSGLGNEDGEQP